MAYYSLSVLPPAEKSSPLWREAERLSRLIPNPPHPDRAAAVHAWAKAVLRAIRGNAIVTPGNASDRQNNAACFLQEVCDEL